MISPFEDHTIIRRVGKAKLKKEDTGFEFSKWTANIELPTDFVDPQH